MEYVVFDLEWNQSDSGREAANEIMPFEIVEIGALKINETGERLSCFDELVKPIAYKRMHRFTGELINISMEDLQNEKTFDIVGKAFIDWCNQSEFTFVTWGPQDLCELQRNIRYHNLTPLSDGPIPFLDAQKLFARCFKEGKSVRSLESAVDCLEIHKDIPFHRAYSDAYYTAKVFTRIKEMNPELLDFVSYDTYNPPLNKKSEIKKRFVDYEKYITRPFGDKKDILKDKDIANLNCFVCGKNLKRTINWFTINNKHYYCIGECKQHGIMKGKIRLHKMADGKIYVVKTTRMVSKEDAEAVLKKREHELALKKKHAEKNGQNKND